jgi:hypothetical protein
MMCETEPQCPRASAGAAVPEFVGGCHKRICSYSRAADHIEADHVPLNTRANPRAAMYSRIDLPAAG